MATRGQNRVSEAPDGSLYVTAPAKLNLFLHITGRRDDGYHVLESLFAFTRRGDLLRFREASEFSFSVLGPCADMLSGCATADNLVARAAHALAKRAGRPCEVHIELEKQLPTAAGLGGGSADAAATLVGLNQLWSLDLAEQQLGEIALSLGADVPACLSSTPQIVRGIGEKLTPISIGWSAGVVIVNPRKSLATSQVFSGFKMFREERGLPPFDVAISDLERVCSKIELLNVLTSNSLQDPALKFCPDIMEIERFLRLNSQYELLRMSGSGASVFALYHDKAAADAVARRVREHHPDWWVMADEIGG